jgi:two-component sensor histidine kinase
VHELLYRSQNLNQINLAEYIAELATNLYNAASLNSERVTLKVDAQPIWVSIALAIPCGLIVNELVTNALKYAFPSERIGQIHITIQSGDRHHVILKVGDNGIGLPLNFNWQNPESLGLQIVTTLTNQLQGTIELTKTESGTEFVVRFTADF